MTITEPKQNEKISDSSLQVSGDCEINDKSNIWVLHHRRGSGSLWMLHRATPCDGGHWEVGPINLHNQIGFIDIVATTFEEQRGEEEIRRLLEGINGDKLLGRLRGETSDRATVSVEKVRQ